MEFVFRLTAWLHEGPSIFNFGLVFFKWDSWFFTRWVPGLTNKITACIYLQYVNIMLYLHQNHCIYLLTVNVNIILYLNMFLWWVRGEDTTSPPRWFLSIYSLEYFPNVFLFTNPGACKSRRCFPTIIQVSVKNVCIEQQEFDIDLFSNSKCTCCTLLF